MQTLLIALVSVWPVLAWAQVHTPGPEYPEKAREANITGSGTCQVTFGASRRVAKAVMLKSTGAKILGDNTLAWARAHWTGAPDTRVEVPITYRLSQTAARSPGGLHTPAVPYPLQARVAHIGGKGSCRVVFGPSGQVTRASMVESTGSDILDGNTVNFARANWTGRPNTTVTVPVAYRLPR